jgi:hypothetical protein
MLLEMSGSSVKSSPCLLCTCELFCYSYVRSFEACSILFFAKSLMFFLSEIRQFGLIPGLSGVLKSVFSFGIVQDEAPNLRKISKLAEYASKNPMRIPKVSLNFELALFCME